MKWMNICWENSFSCSSQQQHETVCGHNETWQEDNKQTTKNKIVTKVRWHLAERKT